MRADFHVHTSFSRDSDSAPEKMIQAAIQKGLQTICITDHEDIDFKEPGWEIDFENYFERGMITDWCHSKEERGEYYCYNEGQVSFITSYFDKKKVAHYSFFKEYYWVIRFDRNEDFGVM